MSATTTGPALIRFGDFSLDLRSGELTRNGGDRVLLPYQPFRLLAALARRSGEVITREDLRVELWADDTYVDFEHSLNAAIRRLREALGDSATTPQFIETLPRRGYRFIARVEGNSGAPHTATRGPVVAAEAVRDARRPDPCRIAGCTCRPLDQSLRGHSPPEQSPRVSPSW